VAKPITLCAGSLEPGAGRPAAVNEEVASHPAPGKSRLFVLQGRADAASVMDFSSATQVDPAGFRQHLGQDFGLVLDQLLARGGKAAMAEPHTACVVRDPLRRTKGAEL